MKRLLNSSNLLICCFSFLFNYLPAQPDVVFTSWITSGLSSPVDIANAGDGSNRLFIVERAGLIKIIENNTVLETPFLNIDDRVLGGGERGLLGLAFHPDYETNGYFYVNYSNNSGHTVISRFSVNPNNEDLGNPDSELILLTVNQPYNNHNGGDLSFGPNDGYLYIGLGDGGSAGDPQNRAQNGRCFLGKILRIDVDGGGNPASPSQTFGDCIYTSTSNYTVPDDNPFLNNPLILDEIWSTGLRNPWRFSFDSANGNMWIADVGQNAWEEVNFENAGDGGNNYGWRCYEGDHNYNINGCADPSNYIDPGFEYAHSQGSSITGGYVYRGTNFPNMLGYYIVADYVSNRVWSLFREDDGDIISTNHGTNTGADNISSFGVGENGEMYAANLSGIIYKVEDNSPLPVELTSFTGTHESGVNRLKWTTASEINSAYFDIEKSTDGRSFTSIGKVTASGDTNHSQKYQFEDHQANLAVVYYRLKIVDKDGSFEYSRMINISIDALFEFSIYPNPNSGEFSIFVNGKLNGKSTFEIFNSKGELTLMEEFDKTRSFQKTYDLSHYPKGIYLVRFTSEDFLETQKLVIR